MMALILNEPLSIRNWISHPLQQARMGRETETQGRTRKESGIMRGVCEREKEEEFMTLMPDSRCNHPALAARRSGNGR
jgi:hypothetical protein